MDKNVYFPMQRKRASLAIFQQTEASFDQKAARSTALTSAQLRLHSLKGHREAFLSFMACRNVFLGLPELYKEDFISLE